MNMKKLLATLLAVLMLATGAVAALSSVAATPVAAESTYSFFPACDICFDCGDCNEFIFTYYSTFYADIAVSFPSAFIAGEVPMSFLMSLLAVGLDDTLSGIETVRLTVALLDQYVLPAAIAYGVEVSRLDALTDFNNVSAAAINQAFVSAGLAGSHVIFTLPTTSSWAAARTAIMNVNDVLVANLVGQGVNVPQWQRSNPSIGEPITTTTTTTAAETTTTAATTTTTAATTTTTVATTAATTTTTATTEATTTTTAATTTTVATTEATTTTTQATATTPSEGNTAANVLSIIGIIALVIINIFAIFSFVRILINM